MISRVAIVESEGSLRLMSAYLGIRVANLGKLGLRILRFGNWKRERKWKSEMVKIWIRILAGLDIQPV
jgi:hypothetical protein